MPNAEQHPQDQAEQLVLSQEDWEASWAREYTILVTVAYKLTGNRAEAEDAVQEAFVSLAEKGFREDLALRGKAPEDAVRAFLVGVVRKKVLDIWRQRQRPLPPAPPERRVELDPAAAVHQYRFPAEMQPLAVRLTPTSRALFGFILAHLDRDPEEHWPLWAATQGWQPDSRVQRNSHFDQPKRRLRTELRALGIYDLLT